MFNNLHKYKKKIALIGENNERISYDLLLKKIKLLNINLKKNSIILLISNNSVESICGYVCFLKNNHLTIIVDQNFSDKFLKDIIKAFSPGYVYSPKKNFLENKNFQKLFSDNNFILYKKKKKFLKIFNKKNYLLLSTSGTTNNPKFVRLSKNNLQDNTKKIINYLNIKSHHTTITTMPMAYSYGLSIINSHIECGSKIVVNNSTIFEKIFWKKISTFKVNSFGGVPKFYEYLEKLKFEKMNIKSIKYLTQAGGKLLNSQISYLNKICKLNRIKFYTMYGQTEAAPRMSFLNPSKFFDKKGSIGKPLSKYTFFLMDKNNKKIKSPFVEGELFFKGKNVSLGYAKKSKDFMRGDENKKILPTGDIAYRDEQGFYYITSRKNRFIKLYGIRFDLDDIEKFLLKKKINVKCYSDKDKLLILLNDNNQETNIKNILNYQFRIRSSEIFFKKNDRKKYFTNFKNLNGK
jgi:long-chain acyl-CoA synthetase